MIFQLTDDVRLAGTKREWQLQRRKTRKDGREEWRPFKFYSSMSAAFRSCAEYDARMSVATEDLVRRIDRLEDAVVNANAQFLRSVDRRIETSLNKEELGHAISR